MLAQIGCGTTNDAKIRWMPAGQVRDLAKQRASNPQAVLLADSRSPREFAAEHIEGARNIQLEEIQPKALKIANFAKYDNIVVYGTDRASVSARGLAKRFMANSYSDVYVLEGGLEEWKATGGAVVTGAAKTPAEPNPKDPGAKQSN